jgi:hypothetical protein
MRHFAVTAAAALGLAACTADSPDQYRFVYNAFSERQIRAYELRLGTEGPDHSSRARNKAGNVANFQFRNPLGPWELRRSDTQLTSVEAAAIVDGLTKDVAESPPSAGQRLRSNKFYWALGACQSGVFGLHAFEQDRVAIESLAFRGPLLAHDMTEVEFLEAKQIEGFADNAFEIRINRTGDGIVGFL